MGKYEPLIEFLKSASQSEVPMTFNDIEKLIGSKLPNSANEYRAWWSNNPMNSVMTKAWLEAGWKSEQVDMKARKLVFRRVGDGGGGKYSPSAARAATVFGVLMGTVLIPPGMDLTEATGERWSADQGRRGE